MGNAQLGLESQKMKCFPTTRKISDAPLQSKSSVGKPSSNDENASKMHLTSRTPKTSNSPTAADENTKKSRSRYSLQRITRATSHLTRGLSRFFLGRRFQSENPAQIQADMAISNLSPGSDLKSTNESNKNSHSIHDSRQSESFRSFGLCLTQPCVRPASLPVRPFSTSDAASLSPNLNLASELSRSVFTPFPEKETSDGFKLLSSIPSTSGRIASEDVIGTLGRLRSIPSGTYPLRRGSEYSASNSQNRRNRMSKLSNSPSLGSAVPTATPMACTLLHYPSVDRAFPFLPEGTGYFLSDEQHRSVEQNLCSTKLSLHRLKRLLIEASDNHLSLSIPVGTPEVDSSSTNSPATRFSFYFSKEPNNLKDAQQEIGRLREENMRLMDELVKREKLIQLFLQNKPGSYQMAL